MKTMLYRNSVIESLQLLENVRNQVFTQIVNIAANGEMKEVLDVFEEGDYYTFDIDQFEDSTDVNIQKLLHLCKNIEGIYDSLLNVNAVGDEELIP
ncbi:hypothetical protein [Sphingobacterium rhinopitheci]|uniref:hypothetical protein n=1 Tax=Sphingobacterium rhinopitheci TaxID=2781960 RepID=UPI001F524E86|nr:hypothetical protein [Sphingobacterium rhinopitheci]MCI0922154.1 hypothetical protein [Sphingobacterium rhinopitheci]